MVASISSSVEDIRKKVRRLTASPSTLQLSNDDLDMYINTAYSQDMPADIKNNFFRDVVDVYTKPNVDRYALSGTLSANTSGNVYEAISDPVYIEGQPGTLYKDRSQFYAQWPKDATEDNSLQGDGTNGPFVLNVGSPILQNEVTIGVDFGGDYHNFKDDGDPGGTGTGQIVDVADAAAVSQGTVVYSTGVITFSPTASPTNGATIRIWYYLYSAGRPYSVLYWKDELIVRPVPDGSYKIQLEAYKYPTQFTDTTNTPTLNQWWQYIALLAAIKVLEDRQDMDGIENLAPLVKRQESLIRYRRANDEIGQRNVTIYAGAEQRAEYPFRNWY